MAKTLAMVFGIVFVLVGILGFIPNPIVGTAGLFVTDHLHDLVHFLFGVILLVVAFAAPARSAQWMIILGVVYLVLAVLGFLLIPTRCSRCSSYCGWICFKEWCSLNRAHSYCCISKIGIKKNRAPMCAVFLRIN